MQTYMQINRQTDKHENRHYFKHMIKAYSKNGLNLLQIMYITCWNRKKDFLKKKQGQLWQL